jgi:hypothetical protein
MVDPITFVQAPSQNADVDHRGTGNCHCGLSRTASSRSIRS